MNAMVKTRPMPRKPVRPAIPRTSVDAQVEPIDWGDLAVDATEGQRPRKAKTLVDHRFEAMSDWNRAIFNAQGAIDEGERFDLRRKFLVKSDLDVMQVTLAVASLAPVHSPLQHHILGKIREVLETAGGNKGALYLHAGRVIRLHRNDLVALVRALRAGVNFWFIHLETNLEDPDPSNDSVRDDVRAVLDSYTSHHSSRGKRTINGVLVELNRIAGFPLGKLTVTAVDRAIRDFQKPKSKRAKSAPRKRARKTGRKQARS